jgi:hypothetical protein
VHLRQAQGPRLGLLAADLFDLVDERVQAARAVARDGRDEPVADALDRVQARAPPWTFGW